MDCMKQRTALLWSFNLPFKCHQKLRYTVLIDTVYIRFNSLETTYVAWCDDDDDDDDDDNDRVDDDEFE